MKQKNLLIGGGLLAAGFVAYKLFNKSQAIKSLNVNISKIDWNKQDKSFVVFVRLINPANASIKISSIVADVLWKGSAAATLDYREPIILKALETQTIQIPVKPNLDLVSIVTDLLTGKLTDALSGKFEVKGVVNAENLVVPFEYSKDIKLTA